MNWLVTTVDRAMVQRERAEKSDDDLLVTVDLLGNAIVPIEQGAPPEIAYALRVSKT